MAILLEYCVPHTTSTQRNVVEKNMSEYVEQICHDVLKYFSYVFYQGCWTQKFILLVPLGVSLKVTREQASRTAHVYVLYVAQCFDRVGRHSHALEKNNGNAVELMWFGCDMQEQEDNFALLITVCDSVVTCKNRRITLLY